MNKNSDAILLGFFNDEKSAMNAKADIIRWLQSEAFSTFEIGCEIQLVIKTCIGTLCSAVVDAVKHALHQCLVVGLMGAGQFTGDHKAAVLEKALDGDTAVVVMLQAVGHDSICDLVTDLVGVLSFRHFKNDLIVYMADDTEPCNFHTAHCFCKQVTGGRLCDILGQLSAVSLAAGPFVVCTEPFKCQCHASEAVRLQFGFDVGKPASGRQYDRKQGQGR